MDLQTIQNIMHGCSRSLAGGVCAIPPVFFPSFFSFIFVTKQACQRLVVESGHVLELKQAGGRGEKRGEKGRHCVGIFDFQIGKSMLAFPPVH